MGHLEWNMYTSCVCHHPEKGNLNLTTNILSVSEKKMIARWKSIRDNFVRDYKHFSQVEAGLILPKKKKYVFYEQLEFLVPFLKVNDKYSSNMEGDVISEPDEEHQEQAEVKRTRKTPKTKDIKKEREREKSSGAQRIEASPTPVPVVQSTRISEEEKDLDRYGNRGFLMSFLPVMDSLSQADQMQVRLRVSQAFNDVLFSRQSSSPEAKSFYFMTPEESVSMDPLA